MSEHYQGFLDFARDMAKDAARCIMGHFRHCEADYKPDGSEVTIADREAEKIIRSLIADRHPDHDILGEEFGESGEHGRPYQWIIDPIDGTTSFSWGIHAFGTLIGLLEDQKPVVGVIHMPALRETVFAAKGLGCWFEADGQPAERVRVDRCEKLSEARVSASGVHSTDLEQRGAGPKYSLSRVVSGAKKLRFCGDCLQHALVCRGRIHAAIDTVMQPWDIAALVPCIEEAGGVATSMTGRRERVVFSGSLLTSCGESLHRELISALQP